MVNSVELLTHRAPSGIESGFRKSPRESPIRTVACFLLLLVALQLVVGPKIRLSQWGVLAEQNAGVAEGESWLHGRLDLPVTGADPRQDRLHDTAYFNGKVYNVYPPLIGFLTVACAPLHRLLLERTDIWLPWTYTLLVFWPLPIVGFLVFRRQVQDSSWAALLTLSWIGGTALLPNLAFARTGHQGQTMHVLSQAGLLLLAADVLGRRRLWPGLLGLAMAMWSRQLTVFYVLPLLWAAWKGPNRDVVVNAGNLVRPAAESALRGWRSNAMRLFWVTAGFAVIVAPLLTLNQLKFGHPFDSGYSYIYAGQENIGMKLRFAEHGLFSTHFIPENLFYMHAALPDFSWGLTEIRIREANGMGTSIWATSPILLWVFLAAGNWWREPGRRVLMLSTLPVLGGLACYHSPGFMQNGYSRFALDIIPIWLVVVSPFTRGLDGSDRWTWREWFTLFCTSWALLYFHFIVPDA